MNVGGNMAGNAFWVRSVRILLRRYLGWEWRLIPLAGTIVLAVSAVFLKSNLWAAYLLGYGALSIICVCFGLSARDVWREDRQVWEHEREKLSSRVDELLPLEEAAKSQRENPSLFMRARYDVLIASSQSSWVTCEVAISSCLPYDVSIKSVHAIYYFLRGEREYLRYDMETHRGQRCGAVSGGVGRGEVNVNVHVDKKELSDRLLALSSDGFGPWIAAYGSVLITTKESQEITLDIPERSIPISVTGFISQEDIEQWMGGAE